MTTTPNPGRLIGDRRGGPGHPVPITAEIGRQEPLINQVPAAAHAAGDLRHPGEYAPLWKLRRVTDRAAQVA